MKVCFVLPKFTRQPIGGYKIVFEYANRLQQLGYEINIVFINDEALSQYRIPQFIKKIVTNFITYIEPRWFPLDSKIKKFSNLDKHFLEKIGSVDACVATGIQTVEFVQNNFGNAQKLYLIQGYENWGVTEEYLWSTYSRGFKNIVVSNWLKKIVDQYALEPSILIKNPIDTSIYKCKVPYNERKKHTIGLLYHTAEIKGVKYALQALKQLRLQYDDLEVYMFGMFPEPENLPSWFSYKRGASQQETVEIYNKVQIFLCATIEEGYGLTGLEAMACGACLVSTAYKGVKEYAVNNYNALLSPIKDVKALVKNIELLFENDEKMEQLSRNGVESVKKFSWDIAMNKWVDLLNRN